MGLIQVKRPLPGENPGDMRTGWGSNPHRPTHGKSPVVTAQRCYPGLIKFAQRAGSGFESLAWFVFGGCDHGSLLHIDRVRDVHDRDIHDGLRGDALAQPTVADCHDVYLTRVARKYEIPGCWLAGDFC